MAQMVKSLPSKCKALCSTTQNCQKEIKRDRKLSVLPAPWETEIQKNMVPYCQSWNLSQKNKLGMVIPAMQNT
jgi:hypothetical protein